MVVLVVVWSFFEYRSLCLPADFARCPECAATSAGKTSMQVVRNFHLTKSATRQSSTDNAPVSEVLHRELRLGLKWEFPKIGDPNIVP